MQTRTYTPEILGDDFIKEVKKEKKYRKNEALLSHCWNFDSLSSFASYIVEMKSTPDYISVNKVPFSMEEYDNNGEYIYYYNKKLDIKIQVQHINRYNDFTSLKRLEAYEAGYWRDDITYLQ